MRSCGSCRGTATRPATCTTGMLASARARSRRSGRSPHVERHTQDVMCSFPSKADVAERDYNVRFVPKVDNGTVMPRFGGFEGSGTAQLWPGSYPRPINERMLFGRIVAS